MNRLFVDRLASFIGRRQTLAELFGDHASGEDLIAHLFDLYDRDEEEVTECLNAVAAEYKQNSSRWIELRKSSIGGEPCLSPAKVDRVSRKADEKMLVALGWHKAEGGLEAECSICSVSLELSEVTVDHAVPKSRGGSEKLANLIPVCTDCNLAKGDRTVREFLQAEDFNENDIRAIEACIQEGIDLRVEAGMPWTMRLSQHQAEKLGV